jgi:methionine salvage enolase-phosphatase E1
MIRRRLRRLKDTIAPHSLFNDTVAVVHVALALGCIVFVYFAGVVAAESVDVAPGHVGDVVSLLLWMVGMVLLGVPSRRLGE